jgi:hypothetical protein
MLAPLPAFGCSEYALTRLQLNPGTSSNGDFKNHTAYRLASGSCRPHPRDVYLVHGCSPPKAPGNRKRIACARKRKIRLSSGLMKSELSARPAPRSLVYAALDQSLRVGGAKMMLMPPRLVRSAHPGIDKQLIRAPFLDPRPPVQR